MPKRNNQLHAGFIRQRLTALKLRLEHVSRAWTIDDFWACQKFKKKIKGLTPEVLNLLENHDWPGNVRQLRREIERLVALTPAGSFITPSMLSVEITRTAQPLSEHQPMSSLTLPAQIRNLEIQQIQYALARSAGNKTKAALILGITRQGLLKKMKRYDLR
ncbi:helix-turn-helix domain-containing protein [candidate division CSSED10-310 bacterium]|uniref:Helix-turn-helix domain-containing protein n=1 Tax=candidate division CSSED10-310 bacterium TaxID=2855610 RepID=A0ABV6Z1C3_UNCC1